jgi:beta-alanine--pyruvate transaminase
VHSLKGTKHVTDIRNYGLAAGFTIAARAGGTGAGARTRSPWPCWKKGFLRALRGRHDPAGTAVHQPRRAQLDRLINALGEAIQATA